MQNVVISVVSLFFGIGITLYLKRSVGSFELWFSWVLTMRARRCFGKLTKGAVRHILEKLRYDLATEYRCQDAWLKVYGDNPESYLPGARASYERAVLDAQERLDTAFGLAYLVGFGKVASRLAGKALPESSGPVTSG